MAKIHKVIAYFVDPNGLYFSWEEIPTEECDLFLQETRYFEWSDDLPINKVGCPIEEYEKYFE